MPSPSPLSIVRQRERRRAAGRQKQQGEWSRLRAGGGAVVLLIAAVLMLWAGAAYAQIVRGLPEAEELPRLLDPAHGSILQPTQLYDRSGQVLLLTLENPGAPRRYLSIDSNQSPAFSADLLRATTGALEPNFWRSTGVSFLHLSDPQPQTIAERLVRSLLLPQEPPGLRQALRMRLLAAQVTVQYGRAQLLEWYLNSASYGHMAYGAESAARLYLNRSSAELTLAEAALLVAANQAPALNPLDAPETAMERQRQVLELLLVRGVIRQEEFVQSVLLPPQLSTASAQQSASVAQAFSWLAVDQLAAVLGRERLERGGLRITTTLDSALQAELACLAHSQLARLTGQSNTLPESLQPDGSACAAPRLLPTLPPGQAALPAGLTASAVILDAQTGQVLALLGDTTLAGESRQLAQRAPGTLLSPLITLASLARGYSPASLVWDIPPQDEALVETLDPAGTATYHGPVRLRVAAANDYLAPQLALLRQFDPQVVWRLGATLGLDALAQETSTDLLLRGGRATALEMAEAYAVFAAAGKKIGQRDAPEAPLEPALILRVEDSAGEVLFDGSQIETLAVLSPQLAYLTHQIYADSDARRPSLGYPNPLEIGRPSGAKIGQPQDRTAAWTAGYTTQRVVVTWVGLPDGAQQAAVSGRAAADFWHAAMQYSSRDLAVEDWPMPAGIVTLDVCDPSGLLPTASCPAVVREVFQSGSEPSVTDTLYQRIAINRETGRLATVYTPLDLVVEQTYLIVPDGAAAWARAANIPMPPGEYDAIQPPQPSADVRISSPAEFAFVNGTISIRGTAAGAGFRTYQVQVGQGINPQNWFQIGAEGKSPVVNGELALWDARDAQGLYAVRLLVVREDQTVETNTVQVTIDSVPPVLALRAPLQGDIVSLAAGQALPLRVEASDLLGLDRVEWWLDGQLAGTRSTGPFILLVEPDTGEHTFEVRAFDRAGNRASTEAIRFQVR